MIAGAVIAAAMLRFLDPYTSVYQTDNPVEGERFSHEPGFWKSPNGLVDPLAKIPAARILYSCFLLRETPFEKYDPEKPSDLFKVNQVGYLPSMPKFAYIGAWLGPRLGAWKPKKPLTGWQLVAADSGEVVLDSPTPPALRIPDGYTQEGTPFTGEETYEMEFSSVTNEGTYFLRIPDIGRSRNFRIFATAAEDAFRVHMGGLYQKRCGIAKEEPYTHWTAGACHTNVVRGTFASEEGKLTPEVNWFDIIRHNTDWQNGEQLHIVGGWYDAADYDRRPSHLNIVNDLCAVYLMRPKNFRDGQLAIPENHNGIPDILDEAEWGLRHLLAGQQSDGGVGIWIESTGHPGPGNVAENDEMPYALARATRRSSMRYAAHAALLARCHPAFRQRYLESAIRAWEFALREKPRTEIFEVKYRRYRFFTRSEVVYWDEDKTLPVHYLVKAAVNLHALTGDTSYLEAVTHDMKRVMEDFGKEGWAWIPLLFAGERVLGPPKELEEFFKGWERRTRKAANDIWQQIETSYAYRAPWWAPQKGWVHTMGLGHAHPLVRAQCLLAAHQITGDAHYLEAASLANDFHNGCNPQGATLTSGLGEVYPIAFLDLPSYVDGIAEYVPGITPYRWTYGVPPKVIEMVWGGDKKQTSKWPIWRRWGNLEIKTIAASEYTVWETIAPAASVTGYLMTPGKSTPLPKRPPPAKDLRDLAGYWTLP
ncbi:MAG: glycoside hydrolase family 9 protein [Kiritimatiellae bacterium]|nr:glycoside hydrolase family 9 protein [Kiritimatiellia bacterium]